MTTTTFLESSTQRESALSRCVLASRCCTHYTFIIFFRKRKNLTRRAGNFFKFGTGGNPRTSAPYNFAGPGCSQGAYESNCGILKPQPDSMPVGEPKLSNIFGTLSMSTSVEL